jgi:hypothetical protein
MAGRLVPFAVTSYLENGTTCANMTHHQIMEVTSCLAFFARAILFWQIRISKLYTEGSPFSVATMSRQNTSAGCSSPPRPFLQAGA